MCDIGIVLSMTGCWALVVSVVSAGVWLFAGLASLVFLNFSRLDGRVWLWYLFLLLVTVMKSGMGSPVIVLPGPSLIAPGFWIEETMPIGSRKLLP